MCAEPGELDTTFTPGAGIDGGGSPSVYCLAVLPDGRIYFGGDFIRVVTGHGFWLGEAKNFKRKRLARLNIDGGLDPAFDPGSGPNQRVTELAVQPDGKVLGSCG